MVSSTNISTQVGILVSYDRPSIVYMIPIKRSCTTYDYVHTWYESDRPIYYVSKRADNYGDRLV